VLLERYSINPQIVSIEISLHQHNSRLALFDQAFITEDFLSLRVAFDDNDLFHFIHLDSS
jgi:hypothetical protein